MASLSTCNLGFVVLAGNLVTLYSILLNGCCNMHGCKHENIVSFSVGLHRKTVFMVTVEIVLVYEAERIFNETVRGCLDGTDAAQHFLEQH